MDASAQGEGVGKTGSLDLSQMIDSLRQEVFDLKKENNALLNKLSLAEKQPSNFEHQLVKLKGTPPREEAAEQGMNGAAYSVKAPKDSVNPSTQTSHASSGGQSYHLSSIQSKPEVGRANTPPSLKEKERKRSKLSRSTCAALSNDRVESGYEDRRYHSVTYPIETGERERSPSSRFLGLEGSLRRLKDRLSRRFIQRESEQMGEYRPRSYSVGTTVTGEQVQCLKCTKLRREKQILQMELGAARSRCKSLQNHTQETRKKTQALTDRLRGAVRQASECVDRLQAIYNQAMKEAEEDHHKVDRARTSYLDTSKGLGLRIAALVDKIHALETEIITCDSPGCDRTAPFNQESQQPAIPYVVLSPAESEEYLRTRQFHGPRPTVLIPACVFGHPKGQTSIEERFVTGVGTGSELIPALKERRTREGSDTGTTAGSQAAEPVQAWVLDDHGTKRLVAREKVDDRRSTLSVPANWFNEPTGNPEGRRSTVLVPDYLFNELTAVSEDERSTIAVAPYFFEERPGSPESRRSTVLLPAYMFKDPADATKERSFSSPVSAHRFKESACNSEERRSTVMVPAYLFNASVDTSGDRRSTIAASSRMPQKFTWRAEDRRSTLLVPAYMFNGRADTPEDRRSSVTLPAHWFKEPSGVTENERYCVLIPASMFMEPRGASKDRRLTVPLPTYHFRTPSDPSLPQATEEQENPLNERPSERQPEEEGSRGKSSFHAVTALGNPVHQNEEEPPREMAGPKDSEPDGISDCPAVTDGQHGRRKSLPVSYPESDDEEPVLFELPTSSHNNAEGSSPSSQSRVAGEFKNLKGYPDKNLFQTQGSLVKAPCCGRFKSRNDVKIFASCGCLLCRQCLKTASIQAKVDIRNFVGSDPLTRSPIWNIRCPLCGNVAPLTPTQTRIPSSSHQLKN